MGRGQKVSLKCIWPAGLVYGRAARGLVVAGCLPRSMIVSSAGASLGFGGKKKEDRELVTSPREGGGRKAIPGTNPAPDLGDAHHPAPAASEESRGLTEQPGVQSSAGL